MNYLSSHQRIGVLCAMPVEHLAIRSALENHCTKLRSDNISGNATTHNSHQVEALEWHADKPIAPSIPVTKSITSGAQSFFVCCTGIGKVNAAIGATRLLIEKQVTVLCNVGIAGHLGGLSPGAWLIDSTFQHDYGSSSAEGHTTYTVGDIPIGAAKVKMNESVIAKQIIENNPSIQTARIASGDVFLEDPKRAELLQQTFNASLVDMETAAIAQVASQFNIPWLGIRAISDDANTDSADDIISNMESASAEAANYFTQLMPT